MSLPQIEKGVFTVYFRTYPRMERQILQTMAFLFLRKKFHVVYSFFIHLIMLNSLLDREAKKNVIIYYTLQTIHLLFFILLSSSLL